MRISRTVSTWALVLSLSHPAFAPPSQAGDTYCEDQSLQDPGARQALAQEFSKAFLSLPRPVVVPAGKSEQSFYDLGDGLVCKVGLKKRSTDNTTVDTRLLYLESMEIVPPAQGGIDNPALLGRRLFFTWKVGDDSAVSEISCVASGATIQSLGRMISNLDRKLRILHLPEQVRLKAHTAPECRANPAFAFRRQEPARSVRQADAGKVEAIFDAHCANCHKDGSGDLGGFGSLKNKEELIARRLVVPGDAKGSTLYQEVENGRMPQGGTALSADQKVAIEEWIRDLPAAKPPKTLIKNEEVVQAVLDDLKKQPLLERPFIRYFRLDGLINAGVPAEKITQYKEALGKLVNGLSWKKDVYLPEEADPQGRFLRIDLRKLGWKASSWEKIQAADPFKFSSGGQSGATVDANRKELSKLSASSDPIVRTDWFLANGSKPPLYHDVLEMPATLGGLEKLLGIDTQRAFRESDLARSGFANSGVSQSNRIIERFETPYGAYWRSLDYANNEGRQNIFSHPLDSNPAGGEVIFNLPNGSQAYVLADAQGKRINKAPVEIVSDPSRPDRAVENGLSCFGCHATGILPKDDEIRVFAEAAFANKALSEKDLEIIRTLHVKPEELKAMVERDSALYQSALRKVSGRSAREDTLTPLIRGYEAPVSLGTAASDLGVEPEALVKAVQGALSQVSELGPLVIGNCEIPRETYEKNFARLDSLLTGGRIAPVVVVPLPKAGTYAGKISGDCPQEASVTPTISNGRVLSFVTKGIPSLNAATFFCDANGKCRFTYDPAANGFAIAQIQRDGSVTITDFYVNASARCSGTLRFVR